MDLEMEKLKENGTFTEEPVTPPEGARVVDLLCVFAAKPDENGWLKHIKARLT